LQLKPTLEQSDILAALVEADALTTKPGFTIRIQILVDLDKAIFTAKGNLIFQLTPSVNTVAENKETFLNVEAATEAIARLKPRTLQITRYDIPRLVTCSRAAK
jgi:hypothetical protein